MPKFVLTASFLLMFVPVSLVAMEGEKLTYMVENDPYEGYYISPDSEAPLVLLLHDSDGLTDYEVKRANMLAKMGYCFGGAAVLELARSGTDLKGFATFHGGLATPDGQDYSQTTGEILVMHGSADTAITMDQFAALTNELEAAEVKHEMVTYGGAPHAFTVFGSKRYHEDADIKSWNLFTGFLERTLQSR